jgi:Mg-chelatase subunit ChlD
MAAAGAWLRVGLIAGGLALVVGAARAGAQGPRRVAAQPEPAMDYRLTATWSDQPWELTAGRYGHAADIGSAPDGRVYILDSRHAAVHVLAPDGTAQALVMLPEPGQSWTWIPQRLDAAPDGTMVVLSRRPYLGFGPSSRVDWLSPDGRHLEAFEVQAVYDDIAVGPDGRLFLVASAEMGRIDLREGSGGLLASFGVGEVHLPAAVDVAADGTVYVVDRLPTESIEPPRPGPTPTSEPSDGRGTGPGREFAPAPVAAPRQAPDRGLAHGPSSQDPPVEGVAIFDREHRLTGRVPFTGGQDVAAGPAGVFLARNLEIFALGETEPLFTLPFRAPFVGSSAVVPVHLAVSADGRLLASLWHCYFQGLMRIDRPAERPAHAQFAGGIDRPELEGPVYPYRIAAAANAEGVAVLQGRFAIAGDRPAQTYQPAPMDLESEPQTLQQWSADGRLLRQLGVCAGHPNAYEVWWARDVAVDGADVYTVDVNLVHHRGDPHFPDWTYWPGEHVPAGTASRLAAASADGGRLAVLDVGARQVLLLDRGGRQVTRVPLTGTLAPGVAVDVALSGDRLYLAEAGQSRVLAYRLDGGNPEVWSLPDSPAALAAAPGGALFVLGRGRWAYRLAADGRLQAAWPMPDRAMEPLDIALGRNGRVHVSFVKREWQASPRGGSDLQLVAAGVWVFEAAPASPPAPAPVGPADGCVARPDKRAEPTFLPLGEQVEVSLSVAGHCPGSSDPVQLALVLDASRSMNWEDGLERAQDAVLALLGRLDARTAEVALITFSDSAALVHPLGRDTGAVAAEVASLRAWGDTKLAAGLQLARLHLASARGGRAARQVILLVTDGGFTDDPEVEAAAARAMGIDVMAWVFRTPDFRGLSTLARLTDGPDFVVLDPDRQAAVASADTLTRYRPQDRLFESVTVRDELPANMRYVPDSAVPAASFDGVALTWSLGRVPADAGLTLRYRVEPLEEGTWPTNRAARADYRDALGRDGELVFPLPRVTVWHRLDRFKTYLPYASREACFRSTQPWDAVLVLDTSQSMAEAAPGGGTKLDAARTAAGRFIDVLRLPSDRAAVVAFNEEAHVVAGLTADRAALEAGLGGVTTAIGTRVDRGLAAATAVLLTQGRDTARGVVILLSDGLHSGEVDDVRRAAVDLKATGALLFTIGLGADVDRPLLEEIASRPGDYLESPTADELAAAFRRVTERLACEMTS